jgi:hypothetical protein
MSPPRPTTLIVCVGLSAMLLPAAGARADIDLHVGVAVSDVNLGEALLIAAVGEFFGLDTDVVPYYHTEERMPLSEIVAAMYLARLAKADHHTCVGLRSQGCGWGRIANDLGIHPGTFNKLRRDFRIGAVTDVGFEEAVLVWFLSQYYAAPRTTVIGLREQDRPFLSIFLALDLSSKSGKPVDQVLLMAKPGKPWRETAAAIGLSDDDLKYPDRPKGGKGFRSDGSASDEPAGLANSGHGQGTGNSGGTGKGRGKGNDKDGASGNS